jgi:hypothetical protein
MDHFMTLTAAHLRSAEGSVSENWEGSGRGVIFGTIPAFPWKH